jgi:hypothetical protein
VIFSKIVWYQHGSKQVGEPLAVVEIGLFLSKYEKDPDGRSYWLAKT